jgi:hypothetical protein
MQDKWVFYKIDVGKLPDTVSSANITEIYQSYEESRILWNYIIGYCKIFQHISEDRSNAIGRICRRKGLLHL